MKFSPTIAYAEGFPVSELVAYYLEGSVSRYKEVSNVKETYTSDGKIPSKGDLFRNPF
jgi:gamma-glutamyltranspeptidase/glutathione hydrolase